MEIAGSEEERLQLVVWALSDIQPTTKAERSIFERAIEDINKNMNQVDVGVIAGDLLHSYSKDEAFQWFVDTRAESEVPHWFEIAGNHDVRSGEIFYRYFPYPSYYAVEVGNILFLMLADESQGSQTNISDNRFRWWKEMVESNQDKIIVTVTHGLLEGSGLLSASIKSRQIEESDRFEKVLQQFKVPLWLSGHSHLPQGFSGTVSIRKKLGSTCFVNVSSIGESTFLDSQSRILLFKDGSDTLWIRSRNHTKARFDLDLDIPLDLGKTFNWSGEPPRVLIPGSS